MSRSHGPVKTIALPLGSPVHSIVREQDWRQPVSDLVACASESVEDCIACGAGEGALSIGRECVGHGSFLYGRAWELSVSCDVMSKRARGRCKHTEVTPPAHVSI
jgi:hypothetical protein